jgi:hypothetical protein
MTIDSKGIIHRSTKGTCLNYSPDRTRPTGVKAHNVKGLDICECFNSTPTPRGIETNHYCGKGFCQQYKPREKK